MAKRKGFFNHITRPEDAEARMRDIEALFVPRRSALQDVPVDRILPNPFQARQTFDAIDELADAIRAQGFVSRLRLRPHPEHPGYFQLVYGERRLRAARLAGLADVPCEIADHTDAEMIEIGLTENIQRRDLDPLEEAKALQTIIESGGYTLRGLAERLGKSMGYITNRLALLRAPEDVQQLVMQRPAAMLAARDLASVHSPDERRPFIEGIMSGELTSGQARDLIRAGERPQPPPQSRLGREYATVRTILARWKIQVANPQDREFLLACIEDIIADVEELAEGLQ
jgi:ParB family chromosome partitioning protein